MSHHISNEGNTPIVHSIVAPVFFDTSIADVPPHVPTVYILSLELATVRSFLELAGFPPECVTTMDSSMDKLASIVSSPSTDANATVTADGL